MTGGWAAYPGAPVPGTLFVEAFGSLTGANDRGDEDLYSVFHARAELVGWSSTSATSSGPGSASAQERQGLWGMNEAELTAGAGTSRIGWVQVGLEPGVEPATALPALLQCFDDALRRFGDVKLTGLQLTASQAPQSHHTTPGDLLPSLNWFNASPGPAAEALVTFDAGLLPEETETEFVAGLQQLHTGPFVFGPPVPAPPGHAIDVEPEAPTRAVLSPAEWALPVALPEWSPGAVAWVLALVVTSAPSVPGDFVLRVTRLTPAAEASP